MSHPDYEHIGDPVIKMVEEASEVIKAVCKGDRFGWLNHHPDTPDITNFEHVQLEMDDLNKRWGELCKELQHRASEGRL